jgi:hypothetical protein
MRASRRLELLCVAFRRDVSASLILASLLGLFLSQPFHAPAPVQATDPGVTITASAALGGDLPAQPAPHDPDACPVCRATAQTRLGMRVPTLLDALVAPGTPLALHSPASASPRSAPELHTARPRAPPTSLLVLSA